MRYINGDIIRLANQGMFDVSDMVAIVFVPWALDSLKA